MLYRLVKLKEKAFSKGTECFNILQSDFNLYSFQNVHPEFKDKYIGLNVFDVTQYIYNNNNFYDYLKYSFLGKYYEKKIALIEWLTIILFILVGLAFYFIFGFGLIFIISVIALCIGLILIFKFLFKTGEKYNSYYNRTMLQFIVNMYHNLRFSLYSDNTLTDQEIGFIINDSYDKKRSSNIFGFNSNICSGKLSNLKLIRTYERRNRDGSTSSRDKEIFDGFYVRVNTLNNYNLFRGNIIKIRCDENILSSIAEDTVKGIYESNLEISFNSEEMNKSFDGKISGYNGFNNVDEMMLQVQKVLTPSFEQHLLYLRERYNSFNMNITDSGLVMSVNMVRSFFQKAKHNEILDFKKTYREANLQVKMLRADISGIEDFAYYNVFPFLERLYLVNYLTYLYLSYIDFDNYYSVNSQNINSFEESMKNIYVMEDKEFRKLYTEKIIEIKNNVKDFVKKFEEEEK